MDRETYRDFNATELFCTTCKRAVAVRPRLLLVLPEGEKYDYVCRVCGASVGDKIVRNRSESGLCI